MDAISQLLSSILTGLGWVWDIINNLILSVFSAFMPNIPAFIAPLVLVAVVVFILFLKAGFVAGLFRNACLIILVILIILIVVMLIMNGINPINADVGNITQNLTGAT